MYRYSNGQLSLADFKQPVGMNLKESNRWVKKAERTGGRFCVRILCPDYPYITQLPKAFLSSQTKI